MHWHLTVVLVCGRRSALKWHPDKNRDNQTLAEVKFKQVAPPLVCLPHVPSTGTARRVQTKVRDATAWGAWTHTNLGLRLRPMDSI